MKIFTVKRIINGKAFLKDEDRISAPSWCEAELILIEGQMSGKYDDSCIIDGELVYEEYVSEDFVLDVIIDKNKRNECTKINS